jgi:hypothetical protein
VLALQHLSPRSSSSTFRIVRALPRRREFALQLRDLLGLLLKQRLRVG